ncbi:MAG: hypothetical protein V1736_04760 [Pseudomonadota bacterium]
MGALSVGDVRTGTIPSLLPSQKHYLKVYIPRASCKTSPFAQSLRQAQILILRRPGSQEAGKPKLESWKADPLGLPLSLLASKHPSLQAFKG